MKQFSQKILVFHTTEVRSRPDVLSHTHTHTHTHRFIHDVAYVKHC